MCGSSPVSIGLKNPVRPVAITAARCISETGEQQGLTMLAGEVTIDELNRLIVARTTILDLVDCRNRRLEVSNFMNVVWLAMAVITAGLITMDTATRGAADRAVALAATLFVCQRLEVSPLVLQRHVRVTFMTSHIRMGRGCKGNILVAFTTINFLSTGRECGHNQYCRGRD